MSRGRRPLARGVYSLGDAALVLPGRVTLDTSFVFEALLASQPLHAECASFLVQLAEAGTVVVYNQLLELELCEATFRLALKERHGNQWQRARHDGRARPRAAKLVQAVLAAWTSVLDNVVWERHEAADVFADVPRLMSDYGLGSYDAVHAATALTAQGAAIVTLDTGFSAVPQSRLTIFTNGTRVGRIRQFRA